MRKGHRFRPCGEARHAAMRPLLDELSDSKAALNAAYVRFNAAVEPELVDACVYEINAAQSRYNYLLRVIKDVGGETAFKEQPDPEGAVWV